MKKDNNNVRRYSIYFWIHHESHEAIWMCIRLYKTVAWTIQRFILPRGLAPPTNPEGMEELAGLGEKIRTGNLVSGALDSGHLFQLRYMRL